MFRYKNLDKELLEKNVNKCIQYNLFILIVLIIGEICLILAESETDTKLGLAIPIVIILFNVILLNIKSSFCSKRNPCYNTGNKNCNKNCKSLIKGIK